MDHDLTSLLLSSLHSAEADRRCMVDHLDGVTLMENAGKQVVNVIMKHYPLGKALIVTGPGNNGGDGWVIGRLLREQGWQVEIGYVSDKSKLKGDAKTAYDTYIKEKGVAEAFSSSMVTGDVTLIVDAIFGVGLERPVTGNYQTAIETINAADVSIVAVDIPSGIDATLGAVLGCAVEAEHTVTFFRAKVGHFLLPGKAHRGELHVVDIGIPDAVLDGIEVVTYLNNPSLWHNQFPKRSIDTHKYQQGHVGVVGGDVEMTGAAKMVALAAQRSGAGLVTIATPRSALEVYAESLMSVMTKCCDDAKEFKDFLAEKKKNVFVIGPGCGVGKATKEKTLAMLASKQPCVIDADAITSFAGDAKTLFKALHASCVLTPHEGEFKRLFDSYGSKLEQTKAAAKQAGAVIIYKGNDTVIAKIGGEVVINDNAPPWLATAGSGDVLAGMVAGLLAQGMPAFEAACAAVWLHGACANLYSQGMIAEDLIEAIPTILRKVTDNVR